MKIKSFIILSLIALNSSAGQDRGGGGGICLSDEKCITLTQAGFRIKDAAVEYNSLLTDELLFELNHVLELLPRDLGLSSSAIIGGRGDILEVETTSSRKLKSFLNDYRKILISNGASELSDTVELMAFTTPEASGKQLTYLIKGKFDLLSLRGQALILIHEYMLRERKFTLQEVLTLDGAIFDYLNSRERGVIPNTSALVFASKKIIGVERATSYAFNEVLFNKAPLSIQGNRIKESYNDGRFDIVLSYDQILNLRGKYPEISKIKEGINIEVDKVSRQKIVLGFAEYVYNMIRNESSGKVRVNNKLFTKYLRDTNVDQDLLNLCGNIQDTQNWLVGTYREGRMSLARRIDCSWNNWVDISWIDNSYYFNVNFYGQINGSNLNLNQEYICTNETRPNLQTMTNCEEAK